jgi:uridine kinase
VRPRLLGIAGPSCAGKSSLARYLADRLPGGATLLPLDAYYRDRVDLEPAARARLNFDAPEALDLELLDHQLEELAAGMAVDRPIYDFATHARQARTERLMPRDWIVVEGLFALHWEALRRRYLAAIFVEAEEGLCLSRRLARDTSERGRSPASVRAQFLEQVCPMAHHHVLPDRGHADLVVDGAVPVERGGTAVLALLGLPPGSWLDPGGSTQFGERRVPC